MSEVLAEFNTSLDHADAGFIWVSIATDFFELHGSFILMFIKTRPYNRHRYGNIIWFCVGLSAGVLQDVANESSPVLQRLSMPAGPTTCVFVDSG